MSNLNILFGGRLRQLREQAQMSQSELSALINSTKVQISRYENGAIVPSVETLITLADAFHCSTDYLLGRTDTIQAGAWNGEGFSPDEHHLIAVIREGRMNEMLRILSEMADAIEERRRNRYSSYRSNAPLRIRKQSRIE